MTPASFDPTAPSLEALMLLARAHSALAIETLAEVAASGGTDAARVSAANALLDRGFGKPGQGLELPGPDTPPPAQALSPAVRAVLDRIAGTPGTGIT